MSNYNALPNFILKLRRVTGIFDPNNIKGGLKAMDYNVNILTSENQFQYFDNGHSTRLLEVKPTKLGLDLSLPPFSSAEDWEFLRDWLLVFFTFHSAIIIAENDIIEDVESYFNNEKIEDQQFQYLSLLHQAMRKEETLHFFSIFRPFYAGTKVYERIRDQPESEHLNFFYDVLRKSQYTSLHANNSALEKINEHLSSSYCVINNATNIVLQPADMIKVQESPQEHFFISYSSIDKLISHGWMYLDEKQIYIPQMNGQDWDIFCKRGKEMSINTTLFSKYVDGENED